MKKASRDPERAGEISTRLGEALALPLQLEAVAGSELYRLALETGLTAYDASYLWLAEHLDLELVTLDRQLQQVHVARR